VVPHDVGTDETRFKFLDEGFAAFFAGYLSGTVSRARAEPASRFGPLVSAEDLHTPRVVLGYGRGSRMLSALSIRFGEQRVIDAIADYTRAWRFNHPSPWDFMNSIERSLGEDLTLFWKAWRFSADPVETTPQR